ncbi:bactofilin family protein [Thermocrinis sp.]
MFGGKKKEEGITQEVRTLIGPGTTFEGNITIHAGFARIDGEVLGNISGNGGIIIGEGGSVKGDIVAEELIVYGKVVGNIKARSLELRQGCTVEGNIMVGELYVEKGAMYNGECRMERQV